MKKYSDILRRFVLYPLAVVLGIGGIHMAVSQEPFSVPGGIFNTGEVVYAKDTNNLAGTPEVIATASGIKVGATNGTQLTQILVSSAAITSTFTVAINQCDEVGYSVSNLTTADDLIWNAAYDMTAEPVIIANARVISAGNVELTFCNIGAVVADPVAGTVNLIAIRS